MGIVMNLVTYAIICLMTLGSELFKYVEAFYDLNMF